MYSVGSYSSWNNHPILDTGDPVVIFHYNFRIFVVLNCGCMLRGILLALYKGFNFQEVNSDVRHIVKFGIEPDK
jgi:hypothetical protein